MDSAFDTPARCVAAGLAAALLLLLLEVAAWAAWMPGAAQPLPAGAPADGRRVAERLDPPPVHRQPGAQSLRRGYACPARRAGPAAYI
jgi:hypothetical protein